MRDGAGRAPAGLRVALWTCDGGHVRKARKRARRASGGPAEDRGYARAVRTPALIVLIVITALFAPASLMSSGALVMSPMMFDAPGAEQSIYPWLLIGSLMLAPLLSIAGIVLGWRAFSYGEYGRAIRRAMLPLLGAALVITSVVLLSVKCGGEFVCQPAK